MFDISRLVLTRKVSQSINIGGIVTVTVEEVRGKTVRIAVQAPREIAVHRQEILAKIPDRDQGEDGTAGVCVPAGPVAGPDRPPARSRLAVEVVPRRAAVPAFEGVRRSQGLANPEALINLAAALAGLADLDLDAGRKDTARDRYDRGIYLLRELLRGRPDLSDARSELDRIQKRREAAAGQPPATRDVSVHP